MTPSVTDACPNTETRTGCPPGLAPRATVKAPTSVQSTIFLPLRNRASRDQMDVYTKNSTRFISSG
jgi:hypothetical protein